MAVLATARRKLSTLSLSRDSSKMDYSRPPWLLFVRSHPAFITNVVGWAVFTDLFLYGLIVPVLPYALTPRFGVAEAEVQIKVSGLLAAYAAGLFSTCPVVGWFADKHTDRRTPLLAGLVVLAATTALFMASRVFWLLVVARLLQGSSAAVVWTVGLALLGDTVGRAKIGAAMGILSIYLGAGIFLGPILGGVLYEAAGYYAPFYLALAIIALDIALRLLLIEKKVALRYTAVQEETARLKTVSTSKVDDEPANSQSAGGKEIVPTNREMLNTAPATATSAPSDAGETRHRRRRIRLPAIVRILRYPRVASGCWLGFVCSAVLTAFDSVLPLHLESLFGFGALASGVTFGAIVIPSFVVSPLAGWWIDARGTKLITLVGCTLQIPFLILLRLPSARAEASAKVGQVALMCILLALNGIAASLALPASLAEITLCVLEEEDRHPGQFGSGGALAQAYALYNVSYAFGSFVGPLVAAAVRDAAGWANMLIVLAAFEIAGLPLIVLFVGGHLRQARSVWLGPAKTAEEDAAQSASPAEIEPASAVSGTTEK